MPSRRHLREDPLVSVAAALGTLRERLVLIGGAAATPLLTDPGAAPARPTVDVDFAIDGSTGRDDGRELIAALRAQGFSRDRSLGAPPFRWRLSDIAVDVMPSAPSVTGFANRWYASASAGSQRFDLGGGVWIRLIQAPRFIATRLEAFASRGGGNFLGSHDIEDVVAVLEARPGLPAEVEEADADLRTYLSLEISQLLDSRVFREDALAAHLGGAPRWRVQVVVERLQRIAVLGGHARTFYSAAGDGNGPD